MQCLENRRLVRGHEISQALQLLAPPAFRMRDALQDRFAHPLQIGIGERVGGAGLGHDVRNRGLLNVMLAVAFHQPLLKG